jgi:hypothetical protein
MLEEIQEKFPADEFDMTMYAVLPRLRPGETVVLQDFKEMKSINEMKGHCQVCDAKIHVWTLLLSNGQKVRCVPPAMQKAILRMHAEQEHATKAAKPVNGFLLYGHEIVQVILDPTPPSHHRHIKAHVVKIPSPREQTHEEPVEKPRAKAKRKAKAKPKQEEVDDFGEEEVEIKEKDFEIGDMVVMKDVGGARLGVGKIKELGDKPGMMRVEFGQRGGVYNLEIGELKHFEGRRKSVDRVQLDAIKHHSGQHIKKPTLE